MIRTLYILFFTLSWFQNAAAQATRPFPSYYDALIMMESKLKDSRINFTDFKKLLVEKRADGYWVGLAKMTHQDSGFVIQQKQQLWSSIDRKYHELHFDDGAAKTDYYPTVDDVHLFDHDQSYDLFHFYGYKDWFKDEIAYLKKIESERALSLDEAFALSIAYSRYCGTLNAFPMDYVSFNSDFKKRGIHEKITGERLTQIKELLDLEIKYLHYIYKKKPDYITAYDLDIYTHYCNSITSKAFYQARHCEFKTKQLAEATLAKESLYTEETIAFSKNLLLACPDSAILFVYNTTNLYCLYYLQIHHKLRKDVNIVSVYLLNSHYYLDYLSDAKLNPPGINFGVDPSFYYHFKNEYIFVEENPYEPISIQEMKHQLASLRSDNVSPNLPLGKLKANRILIDKGDGKHFLAECNDVLIYKAHIMFLLMLEENQFRRPICFSNYSVFNNDGFISTLGLSPYLRQVGLVYYLSEQRCYEEFPTTTIIDTDSSYKILNQTIKWKPFSKPITKDLTDLFNSFSTCYIWTAKDLFQNESKEKGIELIDNYVKNFPIKVHDMDSYFWYQTIDFYLEAKELAKAKKLCHFYFKKMLKKKTLTELELSFVEKIDFDLRVFEINTFRKKIAQIKAKNIL